MKVVSTNKFVRYNYFILETFEAGVALEGCEVKSIRQNGITLKESFVIIKNNQVVLKNSYVKPYQTLNAFLPKPDKDRILLLNQNEILKLKQKTEKKGLTIIPTKAYFKNDKLKIEIALCKGKKLFDKKDDKKEKDIKKEAERLIKNL